MSTVLFLALQGCAPTAPLPVLPGLDAEAGPKNVLVDCGGAGDYTTLGEAIAASTDGDVIDVRPCTYDEAVDFGGKSVTLYARSGPQDTIIDAGSAGSAVTAMSGEATGTGIVGFTLTGGKATYGAAAYVDFSSLRLENVVVTGNRGSVLVYGASADVQLSEVTFDDNRITAGGSGIQLSRGALVATGVSLDCGDGASAVYLSHGSGLVDGSTISCADGYSTIWNHAVGRLQRTAVTGLVAVETEIDHYDEAVTMENDTFSAGIHVSYGTAIVRNSVVHGTLTLVQAYAAVLEANVFMDATCAVSADTTGFAPVYNNFWGVTAESCDGTVWSGTGGNFSADPLFRDPAAGDYSIQPGSPNRDAGLEDPVYADVDGSRNDVGAWGGPKSMAGGW